MLTTPTTTLTTRTLKLIVLISESVIGAAAITATTAADQQSNYAPFLPPTAAAAMFHDINNYNYNDSTDNETDVGLHWSPAAANNSIANLIAANASSSSNGSDTYTSASVFYDDRNSRYAVNENNNIDFNNIIAAHHNNNSNSINNNSTINSTLLDDRGGNDMLQTIEYIGSLLNFYYVPILVFSGSIGNILSVFVFFKTKLRKLSSSFYLAALAVSDTCFLFGLFAQWLNFFDIHVYNRDFFCQFFTFFSNLACFCSVWFVVAFTVERFIAVMYPLRRQTMCTVRRAKFVLLGLTALGCVHCAPFWISVTPVYSPKLEATICDMKSEYKEYITLLNYWDTIVVFAVPFTTIVILNTFTGCTVWKFATVRRTLTMQKRKTQLTKDALTPSSSTYRITSLKRQKSTSSHPSGQNNVSRQNDSAVTITRKSGKRKITNSSQLKVTKMLLIVSTVFVCLNLPSCVMRIKTYLETQTSNNEKTTVVLQYIFQLLFMTNFGINFVLYCVSGQNFRKAVLSMFRRVSTSQREGTTQVTVSEYCRNSGGTGASTRRRLMTQHCWNEIHELQPLK